MTRLSPRARSDARRALPGSIWDAGVALTLALLLSTLLWQPREWPFAAAALLSAPLTLLVVFDTSTNRPWRRSLAIAAAATCAAGLSCLVTLFAPATGLLLVLSLTTVSVPLLRDWRERGGAVALGIALLQVLASPETLGLVVPASTLCLGTVAAMELWTWAGLRATALSVPDIESRLNRVTPAVMPEATDLQRSADTLVTQAIRAMRDQTENIAVLARMTTGARHVAVYWFHSSDRTATLQATSPESTRIDSGPLSTAAGVLARARKTRSTVSVKAADLRDESPGAWTPSSTGTEHVWAAGFFDAGIPLGAIVCEFHRAPELDDASTRIMDTFCDMLADSARNARIMHEVEHARAEIQVLRDTAHELSLSLSLDEVGATALRLLRRIAEVDCLFITQWLDDGDQRLVYCQSSTQNVSDWVGTVVEHSEHHLAALAVARRQVLPYRGTTDDPAEVFGDARLSVPAQALAVYPLIVGDRILGTAAVGSTQLSHYAMIDRERMGTVMAYLGAVLTNAFDYSEALIRANVDGMTGLLNHRTYKERAQEALARAVRGERSLVVMLTDIDFFKKVNDTHGHARGDEVLKAVARVLQANVRRTDIAARYGGEEFVIVLEDSELQPAHALAEKIRNDVAALEFQGADGPFKVTLSIGIAVFPQDGDKLIELAEKADMALYHAKRNGRNQSVIYRHINE